MLDIRIDGESWQGRAKPRLLHDLASAFLAVAFVLACTILSVAFLPPAHVAAVSSVYLVAISLSTLRGGLWPGVSAAFASFLALNYFFIPPLRVVELNQIADWVAAVTFFGSVTIVYQLVRRAHADADEARRQAHVARLIAGAAQAIGVSYNLSELLAEIAGWAGDMLSAQGCAILLPTATGALEVRAQRGDRYVRTDSQDADAVTALSTRAPVRTISGSSAACSWPLLDGGRAVGVIQVVCQTPLPWILNEEQLWFTVTRTVAVAIERARLRAEANEAEVLQRSDELKSTLLSLVGHEIQTPLTVIKTAATGLRESWQNQDGSSLETLTRVIDRETDRLHHFVRNLLDLSRFEGGALRLSLDWYDLGELVRESLDRLHPVVERQLVEVIVDESAPPVRVDYLLIDRVVGNLILNAVRYAPSVVPIRVQVESHGSWITLRVIDHGPGVPEPELHRIFERFYRREGAQAGAGLGLALCKRIVEAHAGHIWAESVDPDGGLMIVITLPVSLPEGHSAVLRGLEIGSAS